jgi:CHAD domain-containing protein
MSYQFRQGSSLHNNIRHIAAEQVAFARKCLINPPEGDVHAGIHEARKCFKRLRGLVRMARPALGKKTYQYENTRFRDAGRSLSTVRDAQALIESFDLLQEAYGRQVEFARMSPLRLKISERRARVVHSDLDLQQSVNEVAAKLEHSIASIDNWPLAKVSADELAHGLQRVFRRARKGWKRSQRQHDPDTLHDWRKHTKYLRYHFQLLKGVDKPWAGSWHKGFKQLSDILGEHHDLDVLRSTLDQMEDTVISPVAESEFRVLLRQQQDALYREALKQGKVLLQCKPKQMRLRVSKRLALVEK